MCRSRPHHYLKVKRLIIFLLLALTPVSAAPLSRPIVGEDLEYISRQGDTLLSIAFANGVAIEHLAFANGYPTSATGILPGTRLVVPKRRILPANPPRDGLVLNVPERALYFFKNGKFQEFLPVSVGSAPETKTPLGSFSIIEKVKDPTWYAPDWAAEPGPHPPGPDNPLGDRWIGLSAPRVGIHGTNDPLNVGASVTHGCVRCYPEHVRALFDKVVVGLPVRIEYETAKVGQDSEGNLFIATFPDVYQRSNPVQRATKLLSKLGRGARLEDRNFSGKLDLTLGMPLKL